MQHTSDEALSNSLREFIVVRIELAASLMDRVEEDKITEIEGRFIYSVSLTEEK